LFRSLLGAETFHICPVGRIGPEVPGEVAIGLWRVPQERVPLGGMPCTAGARLGCDDVSGATAWMMTRSPAGRWPPVPATGTPPPRSSMPRAHSYGEC